MKYALLVLAALLMLVGVCAQDASEKKGNDGLPAKEISSQRPVATSKLKALTDEVKSFRDDKEQLRKMNSGYSIAITILALLASVGIIIAGVMDRGKLAAVLGGLVTVLISAQSLLPVGLREEYYRLLVAESENLSDDLAYRTETAAQFNSALDQFKALRQHQYPTGDKEGLKTLLAGVKGTQTSKP